MVGIMRENRETPPTLEEISNFFLDLLRHFAFLYDKMYEKKGREKKREREKSKITIFDITRDVLPV